MNSYNLIGQDRLTFDHSTWMEKRTSYLVRRLGEDGLLPEVGGEVAVGLGDGGVGGLGEVAEGAGGALGRGVAVLDTSHLDREVRGTLKIYFQIFFFNSFRCIKKNTFRSGMMLKSNRSFKCCFGTIRLLKVPLLKGAGVYRVCSWGRLMGEQLAITW